MSDTGYAELIVDGVALGSVGTHHVMSDTGFAELMVAACGLSLAWFLLWLIAVDMYAKLLGARHGETWTPSRRRALSLFASLLGSGLIGVVVFGHGYYGDVSVRRMFSPVNQGVEAALVCVQLFCIALIPVLLIGMAARLHARWVAPGSSAGEAAGQNAQGKMRGSAADLACMVGLVICGGLGFGFAGLLLMLGLSAAGLIGGHLPATLWLPATASAATSAGDLTPDRQRVLRLLEEGKINASECSELMGAMAQTMPTAMAIEPMTGPRRAMVAGAVIVLVAFFLPWFTINLAQEAQRLMGSMQQSWGDVRISGLGGNAPTFGQPSIAPAGGVTMRGGDMQHGLGWLMLALAAMVPAMPYVMPTLPASTRRTAMFLALAAGSVMGLYLLTSGWRWAEYGLWLALAGFAVQWVAAIRESRA